MSATPTPVAPPCPARVPYPALLLAQPAAPSAPRPVAACSSLFLATTPLRRRRRIPPPPPSRPRPAVRRCPAPAAPRALFQSLPPLPLPLPAFVPPAPPPALLALPVAVLQTLLAAVLRPSDPAMYGYIFAALVVVCVAVRAAQHYASSEPQPVDAAKDAAPVAHPQEFKGFQYNYLAVYLLAIAADWLQGPYVYALYTQYGYGKKEIGQLFIAGFGSSAIFGTFIGSIADKYGRKLNVLIFIITYALSCMTKHSPNFSVLMVGRLLAGIATSILFSAFESWMVSEHNRREFDPALLSETFSKAQFGNAVMAIAAGQVAGVAANAFGKVAPFDAAAVVLALTGVIVMATWVENYGDTRQSVSGGLRSAFTMIFADEKILLVGIIQSCFEAAMYLMVFSWTPALQAASDAMGLGEIPHGMIFSSFMVCIMIGSSLFTFCMRSQPPELFMRNLYIIGVLTFTVTTLSKNVWEVYAALLAFEVICGVYFPAMGTMRAKYVPEVTRSAIMNYFRVPLNVIVCATLYRNLENTIVFRLCAVMMTVAVVCQQRLFSVSKVSIGTQDDWTREERDELVEDGVTNVEDSTK